MTDNSSNSGFKKGDCECASSSPSPDKKKSRLDAPSPIPFTITSSSGDGTNEKNAAQDNEEKLSNEQSTSEAIPLWVAGASPAKFISLEDIIRMNHCVEKMNIAHKIAMDPNCKAEDFETTDPLFVCVKSNMRKVYWELLRGDLAKEPPEYRHAFSLLEDLKQMLAEHLENDHLKRFLDAVDEILDMDKLRSLSGQGGLNFEAVLKDVLAVMEKLCAPIRDETVASLKKEKDVVKLFEGIFSLTEFMKIDMVNFKISQNRQLIGSYSANIEFDEFKKLMEIDKSASDNTKRWLDKILDDFLASSDSHVDKDGLTRTEVNELIAKFYLALLTIDPLASDQIPFPETLKLDEKHLDALSEKFLQLELTLSAIFVSANLVGKSVCDGSDFKSKLKRDLILILNDVNWSNVPQKLDNVYVQCEHKCKEAVNDGWDNERVKLSRRQLTSLCRRDDPVREISRKRLCEFIGQALLRTSSPLRIPPGLGIIQTELASLTSRFYAITTHNWDGFGRFYGQLLDQLYEAKRNELH